ncbi:MAG: TetR/AcrR family transcriptional regulator [Myxococcota bacterium]
MASKKKAELDLAPGVTMRRVPRQARARLRVATILSAARELVVEKGSDAMKMSELAARAGISIGSLYQYFPDKPAVLRELALEFMGRVRLFLEDALADISSEKDALDRCVAATDGYYRLLLSDPGSRDVWASTQGDKQLQRLDVEDSRANGRLIAEALRPFVVAARQPQLEATCFLFAHLAGATARLALAVEPDEGDRLMSELCDTVRHGLEKVLRG